MSGTFLLWCGMVGGIPLASASEEVRLETLFSDNRGNGAYGKLVQGNDGWLYGTTGFGGPLYKGTVFRLSPVTGQLTTLGCFNGANGSRPNAGLVQADDGSWYGTTSTSDSGPSTIFRLSPTGDLSTLVYLSGTDAYDIRCGLTKGSDGNFYTTSRHGGMHGKGSIVRMTPSGALNLLASFSGADGKWPEAGLVQGSDGNFYGTTREGGTHDLGTVFKVSPAGVLTSLASFTDTTGKYPSHAMAQGGDGNFYGTTSRGASNDYGTVFKITPAGVLTTLSAFNSSNGDNPSAGLCNAADGSIYGMTSYGGNYSVGGITYGGNGTVFKITPGGTLSLVTVFRHYGAPGGGNPAGELMQGSDGNFYGTCLEGGGRETGVVFKMTPTGVLSTVATFNPALGSFSTAPLLAARDGSLYGTTGSGGDQGFGTVFKVTPGGAFSRLFSFSGTDGVSPTAGLLQAADDHFYGITAGDSFYSGSLFRMTAGGEMTRLAPLRTSSYQGASLLQLDDGNFYGTTSEGGDQGIGRVFRATPAGTVTTLASFDFAGPSGRIPYSPLLQARDGYLYGTTLSSIVNGSQSGGTAFRLLPGGLLTTLAFFPQGCYAGLLQDDNDNFLGTTTGGIFRMTPTGSVTMVKQFLSTPGASPYAELIQAQDGHFYGTTRDGGTNGVGSIFKMTAAGGVTTLASFHGTDGSHPASKLVQTPDGQFYGTTEKGGTQDLGSLYRLTADGTLTSLVSFNRTNGAYPKAGLAADAAGAVYGTTYEGGSSNLGTVFRMTPQGQFTTLVHFDYGNGARPWGGLLRGHDGNFYGTTQNFFGVNPYGSIYRMTPEGTLTILAGMGTGNGEHPRTALVQDAVGNFYGTAPVAGPGGYGTIFKVTPAGAVTRLVSFDGVNGGYPSAALVPGPDGNFYGTTLSDLGSPSSGTIFRMTPDGQMTRLQSFPRERSRISRAGLMLAADGLLYGTTCAFGQAGGTVFSMTTDGVMKTLASFDGLRAASPTSGLVKARDGNYYGTTRDGGKDGFGMIYSMTPDGEVKTLASFDGITAASPKGPPVVGADGDLYGTADQLVIWRLAFSPVQSKAATLITGTSALLHGAVNPKNQGAVPAGFQFGTDPSLAGASTLSAGSVADGGAASPIAASLTNLPPGTVYYFRATAGAASAQTGNILSFQTLTYFQSWRLLHFGGTADSGDAASAADPDGDGLSNLMEFAVGSHPKTASPGPVGMQRGPAGLELNYTRNKEAIAAGFLYTVEWTSDLISADWSSAGVVQTLIQDLATEQQFKALVTPGEERRFARLRVGLP